MVPKKRNEAQRNACCEILHSCMRVSPNVLFPAFANYCCSCHSFAEELKQQLSTYNKVQEVEATMLDESKCCTFVGFHFSIESVALS